jgi:hypothetical protein
MGFTGITVDTLEMFGDEMIRMEGGKQFIQPGGGIDMIEVSN